MSFEIKNLSAEEYKALRHGSQLIVRDGHGEKVLRVNDGSFLKLFRVKRWYSFANFKSYAVQFAENAEKLKRTGVATVNVSHVYQIPSIERSAVHYQPLAGDTVSDICLDNSRFTDEFVGCLGAYFAELHKLGVLFRSIHLGNIVITEDNHFGLIDIADLTIGKKALSLRQRRRNFPHLLRERSDYPQLRRKKESFIRGYIDAAQLSEAESLSMTQYLDNIFERYREIHVKDFVYRAFYK